jgi:hypothetical protein
MPKRLEDASTLEDIVTATLHGVSDRVDGLYEFSRQRLRNLMLLAVKRAHEVGRKTACSDLTPCRRVSVGLWRLWIVLSAIWASFVTVAYAGHSDIPTATEYIAMADGPPLGVLIVSALLFAATRWIWRGFSGHS